MSLEKEISEKYGDIFQLFKKPEPKVEVVKVPETPQENYIAALRAFKEKDFEMSLHYSNIAITESLVVSAIYQGQRAKIYYELKRFDECI